MQILLNIPDHEIFKMESMPDIPKLLDKCFKASRPQMIRELAHDRKVFISFELWYMSMTPEQRELTMKNIKSTIPAEEIVDKGIPDREFIIEAIDRIKSSQENEDTSSETKLDN